MPLISFLFWVFVIFVVYLIISQFKNTGLRKISHNSIFSHLELDTIKNMRELSDTDKTAVVEELIPNISIVTGFSIMRKFTD